MRIGILTFHRAYNCGAALQAWALRTVLERMGHSVEFPNCNSVGVSKRWVCFPMCPKGCGLSVRCASFLTGLFTFVRHFPTNVLTIPCLDIMRHRYRRFRERFIPERACVPADFSRFYDVVITGSDQVWNEAIDEEDCPLFFGEWGRGDVRLIAYAVSYGDRDLPVSTVQRLKKDLPNFSSVSVREEHAQKELEDLSGREVFHALDPTLLLSAQAYDGIADGKVPQEPYLFMYVLTSEAFFIQTARDLARRLGVRCVIASCYQSTRWKKPTEMVMSISPDRLVQYVRNATYVLTSSFHGTALSVIFHKPFLSLQMKRNVSSSRIGSLLHLVGCENRLVCANDSVDDPLPLLTTPLLDYSLDLERERAKSLSWLESAISSH